ncbi:MAG: MFS transporter [Phycisphaerales bacterium]
MATSGPGDAPGSNTSASSTDPVKDARQGPSSVRADDAPHDPFAAVRVANYRLFASGFVFSSTGLQMLATALGWEMYDRTSDPFVLGLVGLCRALPVVLMALPAGYVIDSFERRRVLVMTQVGFALAAGLLALVSRERVPLWIMFVLITLMGCVRSFNGPVRSSLLPDLVPEGTFANAVTWNSFMFQISAIGGPLLAGWIIHAAGAAWPVYLCTSGGCTVFALSSIWLRPLRAHAVSAGGSRGAPRRLSLRGMVAGMSHVWRERTILAAIALDLFAVLLGGATALLPVYADDILHVGPVGLGWLKAAPFIGAAVMGVVLAYVPLRRRAGIKTLVCVAGFGACTIVFGLSTSFVLSMGALIVLGALDAVSVVVRHVLVQIRTPRELRGRVSAVNSVFIECSNELGGFESGAVARLATSVGGVTTAVGSVISVVSGGIGTIIVVIGVALLLPEMRKLDRLEHDSGEPRRT